MMRGIGALGFAVAIVACSSFGSTDAPSAGGSIDAGADGPSDLTGIPHAFNIAIAGDASVTTGGNVTIPITITRGGAATGTSTISVKDLGQGLTADDVTVVESETTVNLVIAATAAAAQRARKLTLIGKNPAANDQVEVPLNLLVRGPSGTLDLTWGANGIATIPFNALAITPLADGRALVVGENGADDATHHTHNGQVLRLLANGQADPAFNGGNARQVPVDTVADAVTSVSADGFVSAFSRTSWLATAARASSVLVPTADWIRPSLRPRATACWQWIPAAHRAALLRI